MTRFNGGIFQGRLTYDWQGENITRKVSISAQGGSKEFQSLYFEVPTEDATPERPAYEARDGFLEYALSFYQSYQTGRFSINVGGTLRSYDLSANSASPLHKANQSVNVFLGLNYVLGGSSRPEVPVEETSGIINSIRSNRHNQQMRDSL
ncbi:MltA-interacting protein MipA [compost metagenome]